jgi:hypothetical protein
MSNTKSDLIPQTNEQGNQQSHNTNQHRPLTQVRLLKPQVTLLKPPLRVQSRVLKPGVIPSRDSEFDAGVIDFGFGENFDSGMTAGSSTTPELHPKYPFSMTYGSGRPAAKEIVNDPFRQLKEHDLSIFAARSMELLLFGYKRDLKNWKGDSSSGSFAPLKVEGGGELPNLLAAVWEYPAKDSLAKDTMVRNDARVILRNKILWNYEEIFLRNYEENYELGKDSMKIPNGKEGEKHQENHDTDLTSSAFIHDFSELIQETTPWLTRVSSRGHPWFEDKLLERIKNGEDLSFPLK